MSLPILIDPGTRFTCDPCGFCCGYWDIHIDRKREQALEQKEWVEARAKETRRSEAKSLFKIFDQDDFLLIQRTKGTCSFLNQEQLCSIHSIEGFDAKPLVCQQFPNIYYRTPRGIEVYLDFSCPEVVRNSGDLITPETVAQTLPRESVQEVGSKFPLDSSTSVDWDGYLEVEGAFLHVLQKPIPWEEQILQLDHILKALCKSLGGSQPPARDAVRNALSSINTSEVESLESQTKNSAGNSSKRDLYTAILIQWVEATYSAEVREKPLGAAAIISNVLKQWKEIGSNDFKVFGFSVDYRNVGPVRFNSQVAELRDPMNRYLRYLVKMLVATQSVTLQKRLAIIATNFALVKWLSRAHAASESQSEVRLDDVVFGIKMVEKFLGYRLFNRLEDKKNFLSSFIGIIFDNPALPATMLA
jgi:Fe-S-cluster containining protein